jgi:hypothetical protein
MACSANLRLQTLYFTAPGLEVLDGHGTSGVVGREMTDPLRSAMDGQKGTSPTSIVVRVCIASSQCSVRISRSRNVIRGGWTATSSFSGG